MIIAKIGMQVKAAGIAGDNRFNGAISFDGDLCLLTLIEKHRENIFRRVVAEQFTVLAFMIGDAVTFDEIDKLPLVVAVEC